MSSLTENQVERFREAVRYLEERYGDFRLEDEKTDQELRSWLDGADQPLDWAGPETVTPDEWFFISTLYGEMTLESQRSHIRKYFPSLFVDAAKRDTRNFVPECLGTTVSGRIGCLDGWPRWERSCETGA